MIAKTQFATKTDRPFYFTGYDPNSRSYAVFEIKGDKRRMVEKGFNREADATAFATAFLLGHGSTL